MAMTIVNQNGIRVARPRGVFAGTETENIHKQLNTLFETLEDAPKFVFNLEFIDDLDADGVSILVATNVRVQSIGGRMAILNVDAHLHRLLVDGKLIYAFEWYETEALAIAGLI